jgi:phage FluMu gp28-like protein
MQQGIISWNKGSIELENGSKILAASTSASAVRGMSFNILFLDEFAFVPNHIADSFFASVYPTITSGKSTKVIIVSTPHGMNHFYRMWHDAGKEVEMNMFQLMFIGLKFLVEMRNGKHRQLQTHQNNSLRLSLNVSS